MALKKAITSHRGSKHKSTSHPVATPDSSYGTTRHSIISGRLPEALADKLQPHSNEPPRGKSTVAVRNKARILVWQEARNSYYRRRGVPVQLWDFQEKYHRVMVTIAPQMFYVLEKLGVLSYQPFYAPGIFEWCRQDRTISESWYCAGVAIENVLKGKHTSPALLSQQAKSCRAINQSLDSAERGPAKKWAEARAILTIAFVAVILNDGPGWQMHMKGMKQYLEVHREGLRLNNTLSYVDIEGAIVFRSPPNFPFMRQHGLIPWELPAEQLASIITTLRSVMKSCLIRNDVVDVVIAACIFSKSLEFSRRNPPDNLFDPFNLTEDYQFLHYQLLTTPRLIWSDRTREDFGDSCSLGPLGCSLAGHPHCPDYLGNATRLTALMCLRAPTMNAVYGKLSYTALLNCLYEQLQLVLAWLLHPPRRHAAKSGSGQHEQGVARARPVLIWISIIGYLLSTYFDTFHRGWSYRNPERSIYARILRQLSVRSECDVDKLVETDLDIYHLLNLNWAAEKSWDGRTALKRVISGR